MHILRPPPKKNQESINEVKEQIEESIIQETKTKVIKLGAS